MYNPNQDILETIKSKGNDETFKQVRSRERSPFSPFNTIVRGEVVQMMQKVHQARSPRSRAIDESFNAPLTTNEEKWLRNPNRLDYPGVDTIPATTMKKKGKAAAYTLLKFKDLHHFTEGRYKLKGSTMGAFYPLGKKKFKKEKRKIERNDGSTYEYTISTPTISYKPEIHISKESKKRENPSRHSHTIAHEVGHAIDHAISQRQVKEYIDKRDSKPQKHSKNLAAHFKDQMESVSNHMRGSYRLTKSEKESKYASLYKHHEQYRDSPSELYADLMSSMIMQPRATKRMVSPDLYLMLQNDMMGILGPKWKKNMKKKFKDAKYTIEEGMVIKK